MSFGPIQTFGGNESAVATSVKTTAPGGTGSTGTTGSTAVGSTLTAVIQVRETSATPTITSVTDSGGNTWSQLAKYSSANIVTAIYWCPAAPNSIVTGTGYVQVNLGGSYNCALEVQEWSQSYFGNAPTTNIAVAAGGSSTAPTETTSTTSNATEYAIGCIGWALSSSLTLTGGNGWTATSGTQWASTATGQACSVEGFYQALTTTQALTLAGTIATAAWGVCIVTVIPRWTNTNADTATAADTQARTARPARTNADTATAADTLARVAALIRAVADTALAATTVIGGRNLPRPAADNATAADSVVYVYVPAPLGPVLVATKFVASTPDPTVGICVISYYFANGLPIIFTDLDGVPVVAEPLSGKIRWAANDHGSVVAIGATDCQAVVVPLAVGVAQLTATGYERGEVVTTTGTATVTRNGLGILVANVTFP